METVQSDEELSTFGGDDDDDEPRNNDLDDDGYNACDESNTPLLHTSMFPHERPITIIMSM